MGLIGDVNIFMHDSEDRSIAEIELMIALPEYRRRGFGLVVLRLMMKFAVERLQISKFFAKISETNEASIRLFEKCG